MVCRSWRQPIYEDACPYIIRPAYGFLFCLIVKVCPAIVMVPVPVRVNVPVLADTEYSTRPYPMPLLPELTVIHGALLTAVQLQPGNAVTSTRPVPPL